MGKKAKVKRLRRQAANRQRKQVSDRRAERQGAHTGGAQSGWTRPDPSYRSERECLNWFNEALFACQCGNSERFAEYVDKLAGVQHSVDSVLLPEFIIGNELVEAVESAWPFGWRPRDVVRTLVHNEGELHAGLAVAAIADQSAMYRSDIGGELAGKPFSHPDWIAELDEIGATAVPGNRAGQATFVEPWGQQEGLDRATVIAVGVETLLAVRSVQPLQIIGPYPGCVNDPAFSDSMRNRVGVPGNEKIDKMLSRVQTLLRKAEVTEFSDEADALTTKAQELMARYSIDAAMLAASRTDFREEPIMRRLGVENPYAKTKALLLASIVAANRCKAIWHECSGFSTVTGFATDLDIVALLYASLLVQGTRAMLAHGSQKDKLGRSQTRSFRQSFLIAYATRIGERLRGAVSHSVADAACELGDDLLPVLASREDAVRRRFNEVFGDCLVEGGRISSWNRSGMAAGRLAADAADLSLFENLPARV